KPMLAVNWLLNYSLMSSYDSLTLNVLVHLLLGTPSSVLHKKLVESQLGQGGLSDEILQATFSVGMKGVDESKRCAHRRLALRRALPLGESKLGDVEALIESMLAKVVAEGFDKSAIDASINTLEFSIREIDMSDVGTTRSASRRTEFNTGSFPERLSLVLGCVCKWNYAQEPTSAPRFE
ncbi:hypothetical protein TeGR_g8166, partial [Tetraparma gracilis]